MKEKVGLWIDHRKAVIVKIEDEGEKIKLIKSNIEKQVRPSGGSRSRTVYGPQDVSAEDTREKRFMGHLEKYYDEVVSSLRDAESILIFGPGEAKGELKKHIEKHKELSGHIAGVETADKMTEAQILAKVRQFFLK
jgi:stalled ribosome rescue protein Dom34